MTALVSSQIPASINTVEKVVAWGSSILAQVNPTATVITAPGVADLVAQASDFRFPNDTGNPNRFACILYLPLATNYRELRHYLGVNEISTTGIPSAFLS